MNEIKTKLFQKKHAVMLIASAALVLFLVVFLFSKPITYELAISNYGKANYSAATQKFSKLGNYKEAQQYIEKCSYGQGTLLMENKEYENAKTHFQSANNYDDSAEKIIECDYQIALKLYQSKDFKNAVTSLEALNGYKDSSNLLTQVYTELKYAEYDPMYGDDLYNDSPMANEFKISEVRVQTPQEAEPYVEKIFGTWYDDNSQELKIDQASFFGKSYGIKNVFGRYSSELVLCFYQDNPDKIFKVTSFSSPYPGVKTLMIWNGDESETYYSVSQEDYLAAQRQEEQRIAEEEARQRKYSDEAVIDKAMQVFKSKAGNGYNGADRLYHSASWSDGYVSYDPSMMLYSCTFTASYSTNVFDIWGTSSKQYIVNAEVRDTGSGLAVSAISIS